MLADPRADALVSNFAGQWLFLRELKNARPIRPTSTTTCGSRSSARPSCSSARSCARIAASSICSTPTSRSWTSAWPSTTGSRAFAAAASAASRSPANDPRRGLLGHGSILTVTSAANRTSPVVRGKWVLENLLGAPPPQPPPGVETNLEKDAAQVKVTSLRQRLEQHRANPVCASCHKMMDPIGFALENFDHAGKWRTHGRRRRRSTPSAQLVDGTKLDGPASLRRALLARVGCVCHGGGREAADLRVGTGGAAAGHAGGARDHARRGERQLSLLVARPRRRQERAVPDANEGGPVVSGVKPDRSHSDRCSSRRSISRGARSCAAWASRWRCRCSTRWSRRRRRCGQTAATPENRFACIYVPHGATMDKWTPATEGTGFAFTEILKPLEPFRDRVNIVSGLAHPYVAGAGGADVSAGANHTRAAAVFLTGSVPGAGSAGAPRVPRSIRWRRSTSVRTRRCRRSSCPSKKPCSPARRRSAAPTATRSRGSRRPRRCRWRTTRGWSSRSCSATAAPTRSAARGGRRRAACSTR